MPFNIHTLYRQIYKLWRRKRFELFLQLIKPGLSETLIDVGGLPEFWTSSPQIVARIDIVNLRQSTRQNINTQPHHIRTLVGDGCSLSMLDGSYDIAFSNSVIEHVGSFERQQQFAGEVRRVAKKLWVQTPAYECPLEPHYLAPFIHYLPRPCQKRLLRWFTVRGWIERPSREKINHMVDTTRLLRKSEMCELFPDCQIITERIFKVIPKSYIAVRL
jgi:hypothetical protein